MGFLLIFGFIDLSFVSCKLFCGSTDKCWGINILSRAVNDRGFWRSSIDRVAIIQRGLGGTLKEINILVNKGHREVSNFANSSVFSIRTEIKHASKKKRAEMWQSGEKRLLPQIVIVSSQNVGILCRVVRSRSPTHPVLPPWAAKHLLAAWEDSPSHFLTRVVGYLRRWRRANLYGTWIYNYTYKQLVTGAEC